MENYISNEEDNIIFENMVLKPIDIDDIEDIRKLRNNENKNKTFKSINYITKEAQEEWFENYRNNENDKMFIINYSGTVVGNLAIYNIDYKKGTAEFGRILIKEESRGRGIAKKATEVLCNYAFENLGLKKLTLEVFKDNIKALNLYKKIGFKVVAVNIVEDREMFLMELYNNK